MRLLCQFPFQFFIVSIQKHNWCLENWVFRQKRVKLDHHLRPYKKINSKQIIELNIRSKTIKSLEENIIEKLHDIGFDSGFLDMTP